MLRFKVLCIPFINAAVYIMRAYTLFPNHPSDTKVAKNRNFLGYFGTVLCGDQPFNT